MGRPIVAIVGRPNVGKSTLFNRIAGRRISIVEDTPGVTRDRIYAEGEWLGKYFTMIDTGGIETDTSDNILKQMRIQAELAIDTADVIIFIVDGKMGLTPADREVAQMLRKSGKPVVIGANKVESPKLWDAVYEFYELGLDDVYGISATQGMGVGDLLDEVIKYFPEDADTEYDDSIIKVAVIGKPNAGKSSLINKILGEERVIVSNIPGTTRDAIDTRFTDGEDEFVFIDTAGMRRKSSVHENIERYSVLRAISAVERADVCLIVIDSLEGVTEQDKKVAGFAHDNGKAAVIVMNKWDLVEKDNKTYLRYEEDIRKGLSYMLYAPIQYISALTGKRSNRIIDSIKDVYKEASKRVPTGVLNDVIGEATLINQPPSDKGKRLKIYYGTQVGVKPPHFVLFINDKNLMHFSYLRYLENQLRQAFGFNGTPIKLEVREKRRG
jgi:GTP-binding protein